MKSRTDPRWLDTMPCHHEAQMYLLRLCANLKVLHNGKQELRADPSVLSEWSTHLADLQECQEPIIRYSQYGRSKEGEALKHSDLLMVAIPIIAELKLRNAGQVQRKITMREVEELERLAMRLDDCRQRVRFYL